MSTTVDYRSMVEDDLLDLARVFSSLKGYSSPTSMRYSLFIQKDGTIGDERFSYLDSDTTPRGVHLSRLRGLGVIGLCTVKVHRESERYYGLRLMLSDESFHPTVLIGNTSIKDEYSFPQNSYYLSKVFRLVENDKEHLHTVKVLGR